MSRAGEVPLSGRGAEADLRILQVITPSRYSGAERVCVELSEELKELGHRVEVVTKPNSHLATALADRGVKCHVIRIGGKLNLAAPLLIARTARHVEADVIHTHLSTASLWGSAAGRLLRIPVITHVHALNTPIWYRGASHLVAVAQAVHDHLVAHGIPPDRISVVHNATDFSDLPPPRTRADLKADLGISDRGPLIVVTAHLSAKKGHRSLFQALDIVRRKGVGFQCLCLGEGPELGRLRDLVERLGLGDGVRFPGFRDDARQIVGAADVVVLPSVRGEGLPLSLLEAAALGKPAVASCLAGLPEIVVNDETGYIVEPGDPRALASALEHLLSDAALRQRMGQAARRRAQELFSRDRRARAVERVYLRALDAAALTLPEQASELHHDEPLEHAVDRKPR
jgi:glycosyltransferase involved in cell wall biosynthesis